MSHRFITSYQPLVEARRGISQESIHFGALVVATPDGKTVAALGDPDLKTFPRSALKSLQALELIESGAADALKLSPEHLALACASHRAEPFQVQLVTEWLTGLDLHASDLACGPAWPADPTDRDRRIASGLSASPLCHNCSGKHTGMLSVCRHAGYSTSGYARIEHPLQQKIVKHVEQLIGRSISEEDLGIDGCDLPAIPLTLLETATAVARFASGSGATDRQSDAMRRLLEAMKMHPDHIAGKGQPPQIICEATAGRVLVKTGAEGFLVAWLPEERLGVAIKTADGSDRARFPILVRLLSHLGLLARAERETLRNVEYPVIRNSVGRSVGQLCPVDASFATLKAL